MTVAFWNAFPVSQVKCLKPLKEWKVNGKAMANLVATLANTGHAPKAAASDADSRCQPNRGAARYAAPKT